ncbi:MULTISPECIES: HdeD family acid-resistance protein [unclassified Isoptericola]|uniref:HdeD family acid-resistance protein n=1 Tax=unclassified Isoptericola TaxID=2623355 RepID=UPI0036558B59
MTFYTFTPPQDVAALARRLWYWPVIRGVLALLFGLLAIFLPDKTPGLLVQVFGVFVLIDGLVSIIDGIRRRGTSAGSVNTGIGIVSLVVGALMLFIPNFFLGFVLVLIAIWALLVGLLQLFVVPTMRRRGGASWVWNLIVGLLLIALAVVCFVNPSSAIVGLSIVIGVFAVIIGIVMIALGVKLHQLGTQGPGDGPGEVIEGRIVSGE